MNETLDKEHWTMTRTEEVVLPHGKPIPTSIRGFMWAQELVELNRVAWLLKEQGIPGDVLEVGSYCGLSACALGQPGPLTCIDTFADSWGPTEAERYTRPEFDANMKLMGLEPLVLECRSEPALEWLRKTPRRFRLILVDGGHSYKEAHPDIMGAEPVISPGGVLALDDGNEGDVRRALEDSPFKAVSSPFGKLLFAMRKEELRPNPP